MTKLKVTQTRSVIDRPKDQKDTVRRLGLHRIHDTVIKEDRPDIRGMIAKVRHLGRRSRRCERRMKLHHLRPAEGAKKERSGSVAGAPAPVARPPAAGRRARAPAARSRAGFEGGQMPLQRRVPEAQGVHEPEPGRVRAW